MTTATTTRWALKGRGYEYCNCNFGCGCNFGGFPSSKDGSCHALVGMEITEGQCGDVDLGNLKCAAILSWPKAIHEGNGKCVFIVEPATAGSVEPDRADPASRPPQGASRGERFSHDLAVSPVRPRER